MEQACEKADATHRREGRMDATERMKADDDLQHYITNLEGAFMKYEVPQKQ